MLPFVSCLQMTVYVLFFHEFLILEKSKWFVFICWMGMWCFHLNQLKTKCLACLAQGWFVGDAFWTPHALILRYRLSCHAMVHLKSCGTHCVSWRFVRREVPVETQGRLRKSGIRPPAVSLVYGSADCKLNIFVLVKVTLMKFFFFSFLTIIVEFFYFLNLLLYRNFGTTSLNYLLMEYGNPLRLWLLYQRWLLQFLWAFFFFFYIFIL